MAPKHSCVSGRGWTLQERFLAPETIHYRRHVLFWECLTGTFQDAAFVPDSDKLVYHDNDMSIFRLIQIRTDFIRTGTTSWRITQGEG
jgi:hypothetical protein